MGKVLIKPGSTDAQALASILAAAIPNGECLEIKRGNKEKPMKHSYPRVKFNGKSWALSRLVLTIHNGKDLGDLWALHSCDNPLCVNPAHLHAGTPTDNAQEMSARKRDRYSWRTHCPRGHAYNQDNTYFNHSKGRPYRICRACSLEDKLRRKAKLVAEGKWIPPTRKVRLLEAELTSVRAELERAKHRITALETENFHLDQKYIAADGHVTRLQAEITRLHEKYDFQELVKREERRLELRNLALKKLDMKDYAVVRECLERMK